MASDLSAECAAYKAQMASYGGVDLFLGGMGIDGHIAFNEPGSSAIIVCDEGATDELRVGTVRYFKDIEQMSTA